ncbi:TPA: hypothetical protein N0F65_008557 [Lagenidium giganteum]|uniref:Uncharacterized protein n=1 Tax=Lagenidium giganteum TaxID=4803 RepID=A0AAV2YQ03_9STRA|nr:TPA: hypothetical protein N0F65_008557 [Lagenidium giganteum]
MSEYVNYSSIDFAWYLYCGAVMMASIVGIMSGPIIQLKFQQKLATPPYVLTIVSVVNAVIVFGLEAFVFSRYCYYAQTTDCMLSTSTSCIACLMIHRRSYFSVIIAAIGIIIGCAIITDSARKDVTVVPASNSVLQLFGAQTIYELAVSSKGGCVEVDNAGVKLDSSVLLANKLVRVSNQYVVDVSMMKCVLLYGLLPISFVRRHLDRPVLVLLAEKDRVTTSFAYVKLSDLHLSEIDEIPCTYRWKSEWIAQRNGTANGLLNETAKKIKEESPENLQQAMDVDVGSAHIANATASCCRIKTMMLTPVTTFCSVASLGSDVN